MMIRVFCAVAVLAAVCRSAWAAGEARVGIDLFGALRVSEPAVKMQFQVVERPWAAHQMTLVGKERGERGFFELERELGGREKATMRGVVRVEGQEDGAMAFDCTYSADRDCDVRAAYLSAELPLEEFLNGKAVVDGRRSLVLNRDMATSVFHGGARSVALYGADGAEKLSFSFPKVTLVHLQYNAKWGSNTMSLRMGVGRAEGLFRAGVGETLHVTMKGARPYAFGAYPPCKTEEGDDWVCLPPSKPWIEPGSALDFGNAGWFDAPAGKHGRVMAVGQDFEFERLPGVSQRFLGVNLCFTANLPPEDEAPKFAANLRRLGYNAVRFHHHDGLLTEGSSDGVSLNAGNMRRFDRLAAALIDEGIYLTTDLYVSRPVKWRQCGIDRDGGPEDKSEFKEMVLVHEGCYSNFLAFARNFLTHVNPFTGRSYAAEPALGFLSFVNEGNPGNRGMVHFRNAAWRAAWKEWLARRGAADERFRGIPDEIPASMRGAGKASAAYCIFLKDVERRFATRVNRFLREELGCQALTTDQNGWTNPAANHLVRMACYGYMDDHRYVDHPEFLGKRWEMPMGCPNVNTLRNTAMGILDLAQRRELDMPYAVSEFNYAAPGNFRGAGGLILGSQAALQNWAALWRFAWSHGVDGITAPEKKGTGPFDISGDPLMLASERAFMHLFLRRDLASLPESSTYALLLDGAKLDAELTHAVHLDDISWRWVAWWRKLGVASVLRPGWQAAGSFPDVYGKKSGDVEQEVFGAKGAVPPSAGGGNVTVDGRAGSLEVATERLCAGFRERGTIRAGALTAELEGSLATVCASVVDDAKSLEVSRRILVSHLTMLRNSGDVFADASARQMFKRGRLPHLVRRGTARISLALEEPAAYEVWALRLNGARKCRLPASAGDGKLTFVADVARDRTEATMLYEVARVRP